MSKTIRNMASELSEIRAKKQSLQDSLADIMEQEKELERSILLELAAAGSSSMKIDGVGRLVVKEKVRYEIADKEALAYAVLRGMVENAEQGFALSDGLLLQQRVAARNFEERAERAGLEGEAFDNYIVSCGLRRVAEPSLNFTKEK